ncbi:MAG: glutamate synthase large subunit [Candidatus Omnitrophica bacterium]|nr:glutamate synthase large subunit [Candidatus Omnitrophota bacterium]
MRDQGYPKKIGLYDPQNEHDSCGVGFVANIDGNKSHDIITKGIEVLVNLLHRGATGGDNKTGDGAGMLVQLPDKFFRRIADELKIKLPEFGRYGVAMIFLPQDKRLKERCRKLIEEVIAQEGLSVLGWRAVPFDDNDLGEISKDAQPAIEQIFVSSDKLHHIALERKLYVVRKLIERKIEETMRLGDSVYIPSFSSRTIVYKGMLMGTQLINYYKDLAAYDFESALAVIHQRYSTNTFPSWKLAHPFRYLAHNGEINTLRGNKNQMSSRERLLESDLFGEEIKKLLPVIDESGSDSACLDNALELLTASGRDIAHSMLMLIPQAWGVKYPIGPDLRGFFEYHAGMMEPWDGPAAVAFTDSNVVGALLDRNGLRPIRYTVTRDNFIVLSSEAGVLDFSPQNVKEKGALRPGEIILVDLKEKRVIKDKELKKYYSRRQPYRRWVEENKILLHGLFSPIGEIEPHEETLIFRQRLFGFTREDLRMILNPMAANGDEPVGSMGCDTPLAVLSEKPQLLYMYFKQLFAQITNPAIDPIREELVMSLMTFMGNAANILKEVPENARLIKLQHPILTNEDLERIRKLKVKKFSSADIKIGFKAAGDGKDLESALKDIFIRAEEAIKNGSNILILSDKNLDKGLTPIPALLAVSALNQHLIREGNRTQSAIILETGEAREVHHMALLLGFGATAVNPYLAFESIADMAERGMLEKDLSTTKAIENYIKSICKGLLKIMSKMGISTLRSYRSAKIFEAVGINNGVVEKYFTGISSKVEGIGLDEIAKEANARYYTATNPQTIGDNELVSGGQYRYRKDDERHLWTPETISKLQFATRTNNYQVYKEYACLINEQSKKQSTLRGLFKFTDGKSIPIEEVEPASEIIKRFVTSAMSFGSISREAHEAMAVAMNRMGAQSNSGEGGEDPARYKLLPNGDNRCSMVKQVASGRFGVTAEYLVNCREMQIKIAQGAKPGEGGQLPGHKVNEEIARVRHSTPGVSLISPPPHHDIYSIEDIKQLIFDLRNVNPQGRVSVKLVSEVGVGTIAAGVSKANADMVLISGYDGGTGASPLSSIKHAGAPWELGLSETQQTLVLNRLRDRIRVQTDGQMKTGRDIVIASLLGAEEFGFGTTPLVVLGCVMMRKCHLNTCPVGVATQDPKLRGLFTGRPEHLINFFNFIAQEIREIMAQLGFRTMREMTGRVDMLKMNEAIDFYKAKGLDFSRLLFDVSEKIDHPKVFVKPVDKGTDKVLDRKLIELCREALDNKKPIKIELPIRNTNLTTGAMLSGEIAKRYGHAGLPEDTITCKFTGAAGQSFGAWAAKGLTLVLEGEANDYLAKGLSGGKVILKPYPGTPDDYETDKNIIAGNVILYGATEGELYINGCAGERFAIRNSGVNAVVEGIGDHGCEYMTGGRVVILGGTGVNFAAGMSGGIAYVYDPLNQLDGKCNLDMVDLELVRYKSDMDLIRSMIEKHFFHTNSKKARLILDNWQEEIHSFVKVFPMEYRKVLGEMMKEDEDIEREEEVFK